MTEQERKHLSYKKGIITGPRSRRRWFGTMSLQKSKEQFNNTVAQPINLEELNQVNYRRFCILAKDPIYHSMIFSKWGSRIGLIPINRRKAA